MDKKCALFVDDNKVSQSVAIALLNSLDLDVHTVDDGAQAISAIERHHYQIVFLDCLMFAPEHSETHSALKQIRKDIPVIGMIGPTDGKSRELCLAAGIDACISKPIDRAELEEHIKRLLPANQDQTEPESDCAHPADQTLNIELLRKSFNEATTKSFLAFFSETAADEVDSIIAAVVSNDYANARRMLHTLKGSCATIYAEAFAHSCQRLEDALKPDQIDDVDQHLVELKTQSKLTLLQIQIYLTAENET